MVGQKWSSGKVRRFDPKTQTGIINDDDGQLLVFHLSEVEQEMQPREGMMVHFEVEVTKMGTVARKITVLEE